MTKIPRSRRPAIFRGEKFNKLPRLLDMMYKPSELAEELGIAVDTIKRSYIPAGLPIVKDATGHIWVNGLAFRAWAEELSAKHKKPAREKQPENKAYCFTCKKNVDFTSPDIRPLNRFIEMLSASCPVCGRKVNKIRGLKKKAGAK